MILRTLYSASIIAFGWAIRFVSRKRGKARDWVKGRKGWKDRIHKLAEQEENWIWFHCASLGEFEQGRNLIDYIYDNHPDYKILVTFFSPSGYKVRSSYPKAHHVDYLPLDSPSNARYFLDQLKPAFGIFIKYELWVNILLEAKKREIPLALVAARPNPHALILKWPLKTLFKKTYLAFQHIFTQDEASEQLLKALGHPSVSISSDTRFDRVSTTRETWKDIETIGDWVGETPCLVAGSTWAKDEHVLLEAWNKLPNEIRPKLIIAPHEIKEHRINQQILEAGGKAIRHSHLSGLHAEHEILWIDCVGILSRLYGYADIAYVGGGFGTGLHNILEPAVFGASLIIGPDYRKFPEAADLKSLGGLQTIHSSAEMESVLREYLLTPELRRQSGRTNEQYVADRKGATRIISDWMYESGWLQKRKPA